jgi:hypothetical protein
LQQVFDDLFWGCLDVFEVVNNLFKVLVDLQAQKRGTRYNGLCNAIILQKEGGANYLASKWSTVLPSSRNFCFLYLCLRSADALLFIALGL